MFKSKMEALYTFLTLFSVLIGHGRAKFCIDVDRNDPTFECADCCGDFPNEHCCNDTDWVVGVTVGCIFGGLFLIGVCVVCVLVKQKGKTGRVVQPAHTPMYTTTVAYTVPYGQQGIIQPPAYTPQTQLPPVNPPPAYPPNNQNLYGKPRPDAPPAQPEGIQSLPPASGGLPGNHRLV